MPGRHGSGGLGGSSGGGGFRGGGSGGFRGGGGFGGGYRGGGWGGGFRGGWGWGPRWRPFWGGWGGWGMPWLFGPRFGFGGFGCGGLGCVVMVFIFIVFGCLFSGLGFGGRGGFGGFVNNNSGFNDNSGSNNSSSGSTGLSDQPAQIQTQTAKDLSELHGALDSRISDWESSLSNNEEHTIPPADAGFTQDNNVREVVYGKCGSGFYVYVVDNDHPDNAGSADSDGYAYTTASSVGACHPTKYTVTDWEDDGGGWYFVYLQTH